VAREAYQKPLDTYQIVMHGAAYQQKVVSGGNSRRPLSLAGRALPGRTRHPLLGERQGRGAGPRPARHLVAAGTGHAVLAMHPSIRARRRSCVSPLRSSTTVGRTPPSLVSGGSNKLFRNLPGDWPERTPPQERV